MTYTFRRDDGSEVQVDFATMMQQDSGGFLTLPDGTVARRVNRPSERKRAADVEGDKALTKPIVSDSLGFTEIQLGEFEADRVAHGFRGIEFTRDPLEPTFFQVRCSSPREWARYVKHRGYRDQNSRNGGGAALSPAMMAAAMQRVREKSGTAKNSALDLPAPVDGRAIAAQHDTLTCHDDM